MCSKGTYSVARRSENVSVGRSRATTRGRSVHISGLKNRPRSLRQESRSVVRVGPRLNHTPETVAARPITAYQQVTPQSPAVRIAEQRITGYLCLTSWKAGIPKQSLSTLTPQPVGGWRCTRSQEPSFVEFNKTGGSVRFLRNP